MDKCESCPVRDLAVECYAHTTRHARFCELAVECPDYRRLIYDRSTGIEAPPMPAPASEIPAQEHVSPKPAMVPKEVSFAVAKCPARGRHIECGCAAEHWYCGETLDLMTWDGCVACQSARLEATSVTDPDT